MHYYVPVDGSRHDSTVLNESDMLDRLQDLSIHGQDFKIYGDAAYPTLRNMVGPFRRVREGTVTRALNKAMSSVRIVSEWWYGI